MALKRQNKPEHGLKLSLTVCPLDGCDGYEFDRNEDRFRHIQEHDPEDAGLSPLRDDPDLARGQDRQQSLGAYTDGGGRQ